MLKVTVLIGCVAATYWEHRYTWADAVSQSIVDEDNVVQLDLNADESERNVSSACSSYADCVDKFNEAHRLWERLYSLKMGIERKPRLRRHLDKASDVMEKINELEQEYLTAASEYSGRK